MDVCLPLSSFNDTGAGAVHRHAQESEPRQMLHTERRGSECRAEGEGSGVKRKKRLAAVSKLECSCTSRKHETNLQSA